MVGRHLMRGLKYVFIEKIEKKMSKVIEPVRIIQGKQMQVHTGQSKPDIVTRLVAVSDAQRGYHTI